MMLVVIVQAIGGEWSSAASVGVSEGALVIAPIALANAFATVGGVLSSAPSC